MKTLTVCGKNVKFCSRKPNSLLKKTSLMLKLKRPRYHRDDVKSFYWVTNYYKPLDKILVELRAWFNRKGHEVLSNLAEVIFENEVIDDVFEKVSEFYDLDLEILKADHKHHVYPVEQRSSWPGCKPRRGGSSRTWKVTGDWALQHWGPAQDRVDWEEDAPYV